MDKKLQKAALLGAACVIAVLLYVQFKPNSFPYTLESEHFAFYYTETDKSSITQVRDKLEENYDRVVEELKPLEMRNIKVKIYPDQAAYRKGVDRPDSPDWVVGTAGKDELHMVSPNHPGPGKTYDTMLGVAVHEFVHCVTFNLTSYTSTGSLSWLYESIAVYEAGQFQNPQELQSLVKGKYPTLKQLNQSTEEPNVYDVGYTIIEYIRDTWGMNAVRDLITSSGNLPAVLGKNEAEFEKGWYEYVKGKYLKTT